MKTGFATQKVPGGKLLQVEAECSSDAIMEIRITGDFFLHPEDGITALERCFKGHSVRADIIELTDCVKEVVAREHLTLVGVAPADIAGTVQQAVVMCAV